MTLGRPVRHRRDFLLPLCVIFDLDGTLILSQHDFGRMREAIVRTAVAFGARPERLAVQEQIGTSQTLSAARRELRAADAPEDTLSRFAAEVNRLVDAIEMEALPRTTARPGAQALLNALRQRAIPLGLFTRGSESFCRDALTSTGLGDIFTCIRSRSAPGPAKPAPEALLFLIREIERPVERTLFVGDHLEDAECAKGAGVLFYGLLADPKQPNPTTAAQFRAAGAAAVAADLPELARMLGVDTPPSAKAG